MPEFPKLFQQCYSILLTDYHKTLGLTTSILHLPGIQGLGHRIQGKPSSSFSITRRVEAYCMVLKHKPAGYTWD